MRITGHHRQCRPIDSGLFCRKRRRLGADAADIPALPVLLVPDDCAVRFRLHLYGRLRDWRRAHYAEA